VTAVDPTPVAPTSRTPALLAVPRGGDGRMAAGRHKVRGYVALTKPRIIELLLVTTVPTMVLAADGLPPLGLVLATLLGGTLAAGSANALNCFLDRDIDVVMRRTMNRPLVTGLVSPAGAVVFGVVLGVLAVGWLALAVNPLSAALALAAILFYVVGYTLLLKRRTPQNIVWGGAAGCMPVLIGWAAVRDGLGWTPLVLFGVIFLWTPPHYWPLSMRFREDYAAAGVPMLPVVAHPRTVAVRVVSYAWAMVACSLLLVPVAPTGWFYGVAATVLGAGFLRESHRLLRATGATGSAGAVAARPDKALSAASMRLFHISISYLTLLFLAVALDPFLRF
jgi:protoheme IX farnesyltransferase